MKPTTHQTQQKKFSTHQTKNIFIMKRSTSRTRWQKCSTILVAMLLMIGAKPSLVQAAAPIAGLGTALDFDGTDDRIEIGILNGEMLGSSPRTIEAWIKTTSNGVGSIFMYGQNVKNGRINIRTKKRQIQIDAQGNMTKWKAPTVKDGNWHHVAWSYSSATNLGDGIVYVDGMALTTLISKAGTKPPDTQTGVASIGSQDNQFYFEGIIDEVRVWNVARSQSQIQANMYSPLTGSESGLVGYWPFEEGSGTTASDKTTNDNDGTLTNMDAADWVDSIVPSWTTNENTPLSDTLSGYDKDDDALTYTLVNDDGGSAVITDASTGAFTYTPTASGTRTFTYKVNDGSADSNIATVTITVVSTVVSTDLQKAQKTLTELDANTLANLEPAVFSTLTAEETAQIPPEAFAALEPAQIAEMEKATLEAMTTEQFEQLPVDTLGGLTSENMGGLSTAVLTKFTPKHLKALNVKEFKAMPSEDISKLFTNLDANKITPQDFEKLVPETWEIDLKTGALTLPVGTKVTPQSLPLQLPSHVTLPTVSNLGAGFGIGGGGNALDRGSSTFFGR